MQKNSGPGQCGSVDWVPGCETKGRQFDSQSEPMPGWQARSPVGGEQEATTHWYFSPSLSPSRLLSLRTNKLIKKINAKLGEILGVVLFTADDQSAYEPRKASWLVILQLSLSPLALISHSLLCLVCLSHTLGILQQAQIALSLVRNPWGKSSLSPKAGEQLIFHFFIKYHES